MRPSASPARAFRHGDGAEGAGPVKGRSNAASNTLFPSLASLVPVRGLRVTARVLAVLVLALAFASAASAAPPDLPAPDAPDDAKPVASVAESANAGASTAASAAAGAASAAGTAVAAAGRAIAGAAGAVVDGVVALAKGVAALAGAVLRGLGAALRALADGVAALASLAGRGILALVTLFGNALAALVGLLRDGAAWSRAHPRESLAIAGSAGGAAALWQLAKWARRLGFLGALPLYSRLKPTEILDNESRANVFAHIQAHPGAHPSGISQALGLGWGTTVYHLARLEEGRLVTAKRSGNSKCYFAVGSGVAPAAQQAVAALRNETALEVARFIAARPGATQKDVGAGLGLSAALVSWHVKRLAGSGVLVVERQGKSTLLRLADAVPVASLAPAPVAPPATAA